MNELSLALAFHRWRNDRAWSEFVAQVHKMDAMPAMRDGHGNRLFRSGVAIVNGRTATFYEWEGGQYLVLRFQPKPEAHWLRAAMVRILCRLLRGGAR